MQLININIIIIIIIVRILVFTKSTCYSCQILMKREFLESNLMNSRSVGAQFHHREGRKEGQTDRQT